MKSKQKIREYFQFTLKDRIAAIVIGLVLLTAFLLPSYLENRQLTRPPMAADTAWMAALQQLETTTSVRDKPQYEKRKWKKDDGMYARERTADEYNNDAGGELFNFDPNTLDAGGWKKLGLKEKTTGTILKYVSKGGKFRKPEDLERIYGLPPAMYARLKPYVKIAGSPAPGESPSSGKRAYPAKVLAAIDINLADSATFERLPGIGPTLAMRIIRFRDKLGGFASVDQVKEIYGLADSIFQQIRPYLNNDGPSLRKIDLNRATVDELKTHPYLRYNTAQAIIRYRDQHGPFASVNDVKKIAAMDETLYEKIAPYLVVR